MSQPPSQSQSQNNQNQENDQNNNLPSIIELNQTKEEEIRKRMSLDSNTSAIWSVFTLSLKDDDTKKFELCDIFNTPHQGSIRLSHTKEYKEILKDEKEYILKCNFCE